MIAIKKKGGGIKTNPVNTCTTLIMTEISAPALTVGDEFFLGSWCFTSWQKEVEARNSGYIIGYHWNDREKLRGDFKRLMALNESLLDELTPILNTLHSIDQDKEYWRLLIGYWLNIFTAVVFDRWSSLKQAAALGQKFVVDVTSLDFAVFASNDTAEFVHQCTESSRWNESLFTLLVDYIPEITKRVNLISLPQCSAVRSPTPGSGIMSVARNVYSFIVNKLKYRDNFFLLDTSLSPSALIRLEGALGQMPLRRIMVQEVSSSAYDENWRQWEIIDESVVDNFELIARRLLPKFMPKVFLEGFQGLRRQAEDLPWPNSPKVIFTSSLHFSNDLFKAWAAEKVYQGSRLVIGEHGGFGTGLFSGCHAYEVSVANLYLTNGWKSSSNRHIVPVGYFRGAKKKVNPNHTGKALLVCGNMPRFSFDLRPMTLSSQVLEYLEDQFIFLDCLPKSLQEQIIVRLYPFDYGWEHTKRWVDRFPTVIFDEGDKSMMGAAAHCRLFIGTYNATTYIEPLTSNFPTVLFWNPLHWEVKPSANPVFNQLRSAGIFHETPSSAAAHILQIWNDVPGWWHGKKVQDARKAFCDTYASHNPNLIQSIKNVMINEAQHSVIVTQK